MITSKDNKTVKQLSKLHQKKYRQDSFLLFDEEMILAAKQAGYLKQLVYTGEAPFEFSDSLEVSKEVLDKIAQREDLAYLGVSSLIKESDNYGKRIVILDHLQDPLNIGRIMEGALHFGFDSLILSEDCADLYNEKCLQNCYGGIYDLNICIGDLSEKIKELKNRGFKVYATALRNDAYDLYDVPFSNRMAFVLGNEGSGVTEEVMKTCDGTIKIDMRNIDSLNVGMAASIVMYRFRI